MFYQKFPKQEGTCQPLSNLSVIKQKNVGVFHFKPHTWSLRVHKQMGFFSFWNHLSLQPSLDILNTWHGNNRSASLVDLDASGRLRFFFGSFVFFGVFFFFIQWILVSVTTLFKKS